MLAPWKESYDKPWQWIKKKRHYFANKDPYSQSYDFFPVIIYGCESWTVKKAEHQKMDASELWCWRRLLRVPRRLQGDQTGLSQSKSVLIIHWKDWCWNWSSNTLATWCEKLTHSKRQWCWERLKAGGEGDDRGQDGWMASLTQRTRVWANSGRWWRTGKPSVLQFMGSQRFRQILTTEH